MEWEKGGKLVSSSSSNHVHNKQVPEGFGEAEKDPLEINTLDKFNFLASPSVTSQDLSPVKVPDSSSAVSSSPPVISPTQELSEEMPRQSEDKASVMEFITEIVDSLIPPVDTVVPVDNSNSFNPKFPTRRTHVSAKRRKVATPTPDTTSTPPPILVTRKMPSSVEKSVPMLPLPRQGSKAMSPLNLSFKSAAPQSCPVSSTISCTTASTSHLPSIPVVLPSSRPVPEYFVYLCPFPDCNFQTDFQGMKTGPAAKHGMSVHQTDPAEVKRRGLKWKKVSLENRMQQIFAED